MALICDVELIALGMSSERARYACLLLMAVQSQAWLRFGHLLDLSEEGMRRRLRKGLDDGRLATAHVRCLRCGSVAFLCDWVDATIERHNALVPSRWRLAWDTEPVDAAYRRACTGDARFLEGMAVLA